MIKKAINNPERIVDEVIEGLIFASHGRLTKVSGVHAHHALGDRGRQSRAS